MKNHNKRGGTREPYDSLFIPLYTPKEKRKVLLNALKNSLVLQEEHEKIINLRSKKKVILQEIKKLFNGLNKDYQDLKKILPNVKSIISYTEKELELIDMEVHSLKKSIRTEKEEIKMDNNIKEKLESSKKIKTEELKKTPNKKPKKEENLGSYKKATRNKPVNKLDRIKNNLKVIENKLNNL